MKRILIINGPNLNLLGRREPEIYGSKTMEDVLSELRAEYPSVQIDYYQSNHEGDLIDTIQKAGYGEVKYEGIVINAGGYSHTSVALADAISSVSVPAVEVHISNIFAREEYRRQSRLSEVCRGIIAGLGTGGYSLAVKALL